MSQAVEADLESWIDLYGADEIPLAELLCDAHAGDGAEALLFDSPLGTETLTYEELRRRSTRLAGSLDEIGIGPGDRVAVMLPKSPELLVALVAIWRLGAVHVPLFTAFGPDAVAYRVSHSGTRVVIIDSENRTKFGAEGAGDVDVICVNAPGAQPLAGDHDFAEAIASDSEFAGVPRSGDDLMFLLYTSGTTGQPKGVEVPVRSLASIHSYMHYGLDLRPDDVFWNIADPGWGYGLWFGLVGPLLLGQGTILRGKAFDAEGCYGAIVEHGVTNLAGAPTAYRALRAAGVPEGFAERSRLRVVSSAGEPLNAELLEWSRRELGVAIHDHYGQSELGMVVGFPQHPDLHREPIADSMGIASPGFRVVVLGEEGEELGPGGEGEIAIDVVASPLYWYRGYYRDPERTAERFRHGDRYYLTADAASVGEDGLLHFASRADDVITSSGYRIGPFEVESALIAHASVAEVAVIGTPDELRGEAVTAFVVPAPSAEGTPELAEELQLFVKSRLAKHLYPRHVVFVEELPRTPSGKVRRTELRERWDPAQAGA
jgi:acetyl-CoA synthetase